MILGIDPGLANTGFAVLSDENTLVMHGCITTGAREKDEMRLKKIYDKLDELIKKYGVEEMAIETLFFAKNEKSALAVAEAIGVAKVCASLNKIEVFGYTPLQVKMTLVGYGRAEKEQVEMMVRNSLNMEENITPSHASDAVAVALTHLRFGVLGRSV
jgi:crossover junction endodeoxyribonuclease RuvC